MRQLMFVFVILLMLALPVMAFAQEEPAVPEEPINVVVTGDENVLFDEVEEPPTTEPDVPLSVFLQGTLTLIIVSLLKRIPALDSIPAGTLTTIVAFVLWATFLIARAAGFEMQFNSISDFLEVALPALTELALVLLGGTALFKVAQVAKTPVLSYSRPPERSDKAA